MNEKSSSENLNQFTPLSRQTLATQVADQLRQAIVTGDFGVHEPIAEGKLAKQLRVSRAPVREALLALEREGLIETSETGRRRVRKLTVTDLGELLDMRVALESRACYLLANRMTDDVLKRLEASIGEQAACKVLLELSLMDVEFHSIIVEAAGNQRLIDGWDRIKPQLELWFAQMQIQHQGITKQTFRMTIDSHKKLLGALKGSDSEAAERRIRSDLEGWVRTIRELFKNSDSST